MLSDKKCKTQTIINLMKQIDFKLYNFKVFIKIN